MKITKKEEPYLFWLHNIPELSEKAAVLLLENCESPSQIYRMSRQELKEKLIGWGWQGVSKEAVCHGKPAHGTLLYGGTTEGKGLYGSGDRCQRLF